MKLTKSKLKRIIKEELERVLSEAPPLPITPATGGRASPGVETAAQQCLPAPWGGQMCLDRPPRRAPGRTPRSRRRVRRKRSKPVCRPVKTPAEALKHSESISKRIFEYIKKFPSDGSSKDWRVAQYNMDKGKYFTSIVEKAICYAERAIKLWTKHRKYACKKLQPLYDTPAGDGMPFSPGKLDCEKRVEYLKARIEDLNYVLADLEGVEGDPDAMQYLTGTGYDDPDPIGTQI